MYAQAPCFNTASTVVKFDSGRAISGRAISGRAISDCWRELYAAGLRYARYLLRQVENRAEAARDIVQDAMEVLWRQRNAFATEYAYRAKFFRTIQNLCRNLIHHSNRWNEHPLDETAQAQWEYEHPMTAHILITLEVRETVAQLPVEERRVLLLHTIAGLTPQQLGTLEGCGTEAMKKRLARSREKLVRALLHEGAVQVIAAFGEDIYAETIRYLDEAIAVLPEIQQQTERRGRKPKQGQDENDRR